MERVQVSQPEHNLNDFDGLSPHDLRRLENLKEGAKTSPCEVAAKQTEVPRVKTERLCTPKNKNQNPKTKKWILEYQAKFEPPLCRLRYTPQLELCDCKILIMPHVQSFLDGPHACNMAEASASETPPDLSKQFWMQGGMRECDCMACQFNFNMQLIVQAAWKRTGEVLLGSMLLAGKTILKFCCGGTAQANPSPEIRKARIVFKVACKNTIPLQLILVNLSSNSGINA